MYADVRIDFIPLPGTKHVKYLMENAEAVNILLSKEDDERIRKVIESVGGTKGARYPEATLSSCFGDSPELEELSGL
jgi:diketogulonate reductase-like aldo/keto reductase